MKQRQFSYKSMVGISENLRESEDVSMSVDKQSSLEQSNEEGVKYGGRIVQENEVKLQEAA